MNRMEFSPFSVAASLPDSPVRVPAEAQSRLAATDNPEASMCESSEIQDAQVKFNELRHL